MMLEHWSGWVFAYCTCGALITVFAGFAATSLELNDDHPATKGLLVVMALAGWWLFLIGLALYGVLYGLGKGVKWVERKVA